MDKFAVIGFGRWGKVLIGEFNKLGEVLYAVSKGNRENIKWLEKNYPAVKHTIDLDLILHQKDIESIIIATPISTHYSLAKKCLELKKNVFVEKPPCLKSKQGFELLKIAKRKKRALFVNNIHSLDPAFGNLKQLIGGKLPVETKFTWLKWGSFDSNVVWNLAYHDIYLSLNLYGEPQRSRLISNSDNKVQIEIDYKNHKVKILIDRSYKGLATKSVAVKLRSKDYLLQNSSLYEIVNNKKSLVFKSKITPLSVACQRFIIEINKKNKNYNDFELSIETVRIIEQIIKKTQLWY